MRTGRSLGRPALPWSGHRYAAASGRERQFTRLSQSSHSSQPGTSCLPKAASSLILMITAPNRSPASARGQERAPDCVRFGVDNQHSDGAVRMLKCWAEIVEDLHKTR